MRAIQSSTWDYGVLPASGGAAGGRDEPAIDLAELARHTLGDEALEMELLALFDRQCERIVAQLSAPVGRDRDSAGKLAHSLRGSALAIGAHRVARCAAAFEDACERGAPPAEFDRARDSFREAAEDARAAIARLLS